MKRKYWWIFGLVQAAGILASAEALFLQFPSLWLVSLLLLLPGSLASLPMLEGKRFASSWSPWVLCAIAVAANLILCVLASLLLARRRKSN